MPGSTTLNKPLLITLGVVLALAALFFLVVNPRLAADGGTDTAAPAVAPQDDAAPAAASGPPAAPSSEDADASDEAVAPESFEIYSARDPFQQLVQTAPTGEAATGTDPAAATASADPSTTGTAGDTGTGSTAVDAGAQPAAGGDGASTLGTVSLGAVTHDGGVQTAQVVVDGTSYEVREGDVVTDSLQLVALAEPCGTFQLGTVQFTLCEGQSIRP